MEQRKTQHSRCFAVESINILCILMLKPYSDRGLIHHPAKGSRPLQMTDHLVHNSIHRHIQFAIIRGEEKLRIISFENQEVIFFFSLVFFSGLTIVTLQSLLISLQRVSALLATP